MSIRRTQDKKSSNRAEREINELISNGKSAAITPFREVTPSKSHKLF